MPRNKSANPTPVSLPCLHCTRSFANATALADHHRSKHAVPITASATATSVSTTVRNRSIPCTKAGCARTFPSHRTLEQHLKSPAHAGRRGMPVQNLRTGRHESSFQDCSSEVYPNISNTPGTIPEMNVEFLTPVVVGEAFATLDSLTSQFGSSLYIGTSPGSAAGEPSSAPPASREGIFVRKRALVKTTPGNRAGRRPKAQAHKAQPLHNWTVIPKHQQYIALTALRLRCHTGAILKANKYTPYTDHIDFIGEDAIPSPLKAPAHHWQTSKRSAVTLDCEMVGVGDKHESEIARISAIDYLTGEILIDTLVQPIRTVKDWRTKYSGITEEAMTAAISQGKTLKGWPEARASLFGHIDTDTVLVGQALHFDLIALGIQHQRVVDSAILASEAVGRSVRKRWGLKDLCDQLLDIKIQNDEKVGHDSIEDAFAAREVVLWCINHPDALKQWGKMQRKEYYGKKKQKPKAKAGTASRRQHSSYLGVDLYDHDEDDEMLRWSDIAEEYGWPTGYDPWSD